MESFFQYLETDSGMIIFAVVVAFFLLIFSAIERRKKRRLQEEALAFWLEGEDMAFLLSLKEEPLKLEVKDLIFPAIILAFLALGLWFSLFFMGWAMWGVVFTLFIAFYLGAAAAILCARIRMKRRKA